jgi:hypothetical protein
MGFLQWLETTGLARFVSESLWGYPIILTSHGVGMAIVVGIMLMIDMRLLGFAPRIPLDSFAKLFAIGWFGIALNVISGLMLFSAEAVRFAGNSMFQVKILLLVVGATTAWMSMKDAMVLPEGDVIAAVKARTLARISIACFLIAVIAGRFTAYT